MTDPASTPRTGALDSSVLVLNKLYMAIQVISARRALCLLYKDVAEVIMISNDTYRSFDFDSWTFDSPSRSRARMPDADYVLARSGPIEIPRVIRLLGYDRLPRQRVKFNRRNIFARDGHRCQYCGKRFQADRLSLDHVMPRSRGGEATWENLVAACVACNVRKGGRTPQEANMKLLGAPGRPRSSPTLERKLRQRKYGVWKPFLEHAPWSVDLR